MTETEDVIIPITQGISVKMNRFWITEDDNGALLNMEYDILREENENTAFMTDEDVAEALEEFMSDVMEHAVERAKGIVNED